MIAFRDWLIAEERSLVDPSVLNSYEQAFQQRLEELIRQTKDPALRQAFESMRDCPIKSIEGRCSRFVDYIMAGLVKSGCHRQYDIEGSFQRIIFKMIGDKGERGLPHIGGSAGNTATLTIVPSSPVDSMAASQEGQPTGTEAAQTASNLDVAYQGDPNTNVETTTINKTLQDTRKLSFFH